METETVENEQGSQGMAGMGGLANLLSSKLPEKGNVEESEEEVVDDEEVAVEDENLSEEDKAKKKLDDGLEDEAEKPKPKPEVKEEVIDDEPTTIHALAEAFQDEFELEGEFTADEEGIVNATKFIAEKSKEVGKKEGIEELFAKIPELGIIKEHLEQGGSLVSLIQKQEIEDFSKVEIKEDDLKSAETYYRAYLNFKGNDEETVEALVSLAKDNSTLVDKGNKSVSALATVQKEQNEAQIEEEKKQKENQKKAFIETEKSFDKVLEAKSINGIVITEEEAKKFKEFVYKKDNKNTSAREAKWDNLTLEQEMMIDFLLMTDFKSLKGAGANASASGASKKPVKFVVKKATPTVDLNTNKGSSKGSDSELGAVLGNFFKGNQ